MDPAYLWLDAIGVPRDQVQPSQRQGSQSIRTQVRNDILDGVFQPEPTLAKLVEADVDLTEVAWSGSAVSNLPGGIMVVRDGFREDNPELTKAILEKHVKATEFLTNRPGDAASIVSDTFGEGLSTSLAETALGKKTAGFITDPRPITEGLNALGEIMAENGVSSESVPANEIVDPSLYVDVA